MSSTNWETPAGARAIGLDMGSTTAKAVVVDGAGAVVWGHLEAAHPRVEEQAARLLEDARAAVGVSGLSESGISVVATGYGRHLVEAADRKVTEITCHAKGVYGALGHGGTLVDIGGQDSKVIVIAPNGNVVGFAMNDKCAAGTGRFLEQTAARLHLAIDEMGRTALAAPTEAAISSTCTVFAESEIVSLVARGEPVANIVRGLHRSLVKRVVSMVRTVRPTAPILLSGGVAQNEAVRVFLGEELGESVLRPDTPQMMGAYGAALLAIADG